MPHAEVNGQRLYYEVHGEGEPLVMVMGLGGDLLAWARQARLVRVVHGDLNPAGPGPRYEPVADVPVQRLPGRTQPVHAGSFAVLPSAEPWRLADVGRRPGTSSRIENAWIEAFFRESGNAADDDEMILDAADVTQWLEGAESRRDAPARPDTPEELASRLRALARSDRRS